MKVIYIISFPPIYELSNYSTPDHFWYNKKGELIGIWRQDWGHVFAQNVRSFYSDIEFEVWRPDYRADKEYFHIFKDGVVHRSFPARKKIYYYGLKIQNFYYSQDLINKLSQEISIQKFNKDVVLHIPSDFSPLVHIILKKFHGKIPFLHTSHLNHELLNINLKTYNPFSFLHRFFIYLRYEKHKKLLTEIAVSIDKKEFFSKYTNAQIYQLDFLNFDFNLTYNKLDKKTAREKLKLPLSKMILFSSSRLVPEKQIDKFIQSLAGLKRYDFLYLISGTGEESYIKYLRNTCRKFNLLDKVLFVGFLDNSLLDYYCASDVFISTSISEAGPVSVLKAISLEIPVISTNTGFAYYLLKEYNCGKIIDKYYNKQWSTIIENFLLEQNIKIIDSDILKERFCLKKGINQLVSYYKNSINNFHLRTNLINDSCNA